MIARAKKNILSGEVPSGLLSDLWWSAGRHRRNCGSPSSGRACRRIKDSNGQVEVGSPAGSIKVESIRRVVTRWTLDASRVAYVGDSPHDVVAAREAGVVSIAAAWADASSIPKLREAEPDALFTSVETLSEWLGE